MCQSTSPSIGFPETIGRGDVYSGHQLEIKMPSGFKSASAGSRLGDFPKTSGGAIRRNGSGAMLIEPVRENGSGEEWCRGEDLNLHGVSPTWT